MNMHIYWRIFCRRSQLMSLLAQVRMLVLQNALDFPKPKIP